MTLTVETGAGSAASDSYASLATASAYAASRGLTFAIEDDDEALAEQALRRATVWLDAAYRSRFPGYRVNGRSQALEWPRYDAWDSEPIPQPIASDEVPVEVVHATIEAAVREKANPGALSPDVTRGQIERAVTVGEVSVEYSVGAGSVGDQRPIATIIDDILGSLLVGGRDAPFGRAVRG